MFSNCYIAFAQDNDKKVSIKVCGSGKTIDIAKQSALRSAIEQAYGTFISTNTEILNDNVIADRISSLSSGYIQSYEMLNESQFPDGSWGVTLKALLSLNKLASIVEAKGTDIEFKGDIFALNIKQQILNERGEKNAVSELIRLLHEPMQISFDYNIESSEPQSLDKENKNWEIPLVVSAFTNNNFDFCANYIIKTISALSLTTEEVVDLQKLNKDVYPIVVKYPNENKKNKEVFKIFYLRTRLSMLLLNSMIERWSLFTNSYTIQSGLDEIVACKVGENVHLGGWISENLANLAVLNFRGCLNQNEGIFISLLESQKKAATFSWKEKRTLSQIEQMTEIKVRPKGVFWSFKHGGLVVFEENGHGLVASVVEVGPMDWYNARTTCENATLFGYDDWSLPSKDELIKINNYIEQLGIRLLKDHTYWTNTENGYDSGYAWYFNNDGRFDVGTKGFGFYVRAVRAF
jgi:hypothetical protein